MVDNKVNMRFLVVIPVYNEEEHLENTVRSLLAQSLKPFQIVLTDDGSTDGTWEIIKRLESENDIITGVQTSSRAAHMPGGKVVRAFQRGYEKISGAGDVICKFDSDLIFPEGYIEAVAHAFEANPKLGICGGICVVEKNGEWVPENLSDSDHVRGALKAYRKSCFDDIGGLRPAMGWDSVDELLALYHGWEVQVLPEQQVKHLRVTGKTYTAESRYLKGEALYRMGYGFWLTAIAAAKIARNEGSIFRMRDHLKGYFRARSGALSMMVTADEARFIRKLRWKRMRNKLLRKRD